MSKNFLGSIALAAVLVGGLSVGITPLKAGVLAHHAKVQSL